jgi:NAD(P)-dependent dehydrogenase (short-subunit alcohol dehydrogenase family)
MLLKDKVAVITGGAGLNGLGYATARQMAAHGARWSSSTWRAPSPRPPRQRLGASASGAGGRRDRQGRLRAAVRPRC